MAVAELSRPQASAGRPAPVDGRTRRAAVLAAALLAVFALGFVVHALPYLRAGFGRSHDGENASVWARGSRAIREEGVVASHLGGTAHIGGTTEEYAHHPPLTFVETAATESLFGEHPWATRLPALLSSLAAIALLFLLVRACGIGAEAAAIAVVLGLAGPLFVVYGAMLDTPMTSLPLGLALLLLWRRRLEPAARSRVESGAVIAVAALAVLAGWQGVLLAAVLAVETLVRRRGREVAMGAALGAVLLVGWLWWTVGSFGPIVDQFAIRSGSRDAAHVGFRDLVSAQAHYLATTVPPWTLLLAALGVRVALRRPELRATMLVALAVTIPYTVGLRDGAYFHDYWDYWWLLPMVVAVAAIVERAEHLARPELVRAAMVGFAVLAGVLALVVRSAPEQAIRDGWPAARLAVSVQYPSQQRVVWSWGVGDAPWPGYVAHRPTVPLLSRRRLASAAGQHPDDLAIARLGETYRALTLRELATLRPVDAPPAR